ncbi:unnamed protein product [Rotaria magnacalcarata]|uniref:Eukaryotic translation initiation factor 3 subunit M n=1 Tax=Rotaria magnacalcarata TaxID=392030 RepID=A0A8S2LI09_9BILA|nr:unnamed protein product [Rotaria magnacalcarata]
MAQAAASNLRRRILGSRQDSPSTLPMQSATNDIPSALSINVNPLLLNSQHRPLVRIDRRSIEKVWKQMDRIVKYCQMPKMNLKNSPPYMLDILPDLYQTLREIMNNYDDRLHILNDIDYFRIFIDNLIDQCTKTIDCFKRAGHHMYDEQSTYRKHLTKLSLYFSHNLAELKSLFNRGIYEGEKFRLTKQEANDFWKCNFNERTIVPWEEFKERLNQIHPIQTINEATALQNTIDLTNNNHVSIFEFDQTLDANPNVQTLQSLAIARPLNHENSHLNNNSPSSSDVMSSTPPPIPPRPVTIKPSGTRVSADTISRSQLQQPSHQTVPPPPLPPPLHNNNDILPLSQRILTKNQQTLSSASSSESLNDSLALRSTASSELATTRSLILHNSATNQTRPVRQTASPILDPATNTNEQFRTIEDIRVRLIDEHTIEQPRIEAVLILTQGLPLMKQYELAKSFLRQVQQEQQSLNQNNTFVNGSFIKKMKEIPTTCVAAVYSEIEPEPQLKDIEKFMRDHGADPVLDVSSEDLESRVESIVRELRHVLKDSFLEGEMEMFLNSVMSLILVVPEDKINRPVLNFSEATVNANLPEKYGPMKIRVLTNLIYVVPEHANIDKYRILIDLIKCARNHRCINTVPVGIDQIKLWVKEWNVSIEQIQELYRNMHEAYVASGDSTNALQLLLELLGTYTKETASKARTDAVKCIINSINDPNVFLMDHLLLLEPVKMLEGENIHNLLKIFVFSRLQDYLEFYSKQKPFIESSVYLGVKHERNLTKMRLLTFILIAENQKELTFDAIEKEMQISADDIESFIIEAVRTKMIRCKIDHLARKVIVDNTEQRSFTKQHWISLKEKLEAWKSNLTMINSHFHTLAN